MLQGEVRRNTRVRLLRNGTEIFNGEISSLKHEKDDVKEVARGLECGIKLSGFNDVKKDDVLEAYKIEEVARTL